MQVRLTASEAKNREDQRLASQVADQLRAELRAYQRFEVEAKADLAERDRRILGAASEANELCLARERAIQHERDTAQANISIIRAQAQQYHEHAMREAEARAEANHASMIAALRSELQSALEEQRKAVGGGISAVAAPRLGLPGAGPPPKLGLQQRLTRLQRRVLARPA